VETVARIEGIRPFLIHSERYVQVYYSQIDDPETIHQARLGESDLPDGLAVGDLVTVYAVLGVVAEIRRASDQSPS
jgi:hypothetical protein